MFICITLSPIRIIANRLVWYVDIIIPQQTIQPPISQGVTNTSQTPLPKPRPPVLLGVLLVSLLILGGSYFIFGTKKTETPTHPVSQTSPTAISTVDLSRESNGSAIIANWKTYMNQDYGFKISYPPKAISHDA